MVEYRKYVFYENLALMSFIFTSVLITIGDPDLIDALIHFLMK